MSLIWYDSIEIFFASHFAIFSDRRLFTGLFLSNFEIAECKNQVNINFGKIRSAGIKILPFLCFVIFSERNIMIQSRYL